MMIRADVAWRELFGDGSEWTRTPAETDPWAAHERFLLEVAKLSAVDPVTSELVKLRGEGPCVPALPVPAQRDRNRPGRWIRAVRRS